MSEGLCRYLVDIVDIVDTVDIVDVVDIVDIFYQMCCHNMT